MAKEELTEYQQYAKIVASVKAEAATMTGDQCTWEIQRRWAKHKGQPFKKPRPERLIPSTAHSAALQANLPVPPETPPEGAIKKPVSPAMAKVENEDAEDRPVRPMSRR